MYTQPLYCSLSFPDSTPKKASRAGDPQDTRRSLLYFSLPETTMLQVHLSYQGQQCRGPAGRGLAFTAAPPAR